MKSFSLSPEILDELEKEHLAFLASRLTSERAREDWVRSFRDGWAWAQGLRVREVLDPEAATDGLARALSDASVTGLFAPVARDFHRRALQTLRTDDARIAEFVDAEARTAIDALLERSDLVPEKLIREIFAQRAIEEALRDILFDGLQEFNQTANPFFAEWGLPAILKRMPIGGGAILKSMGAVKSEFDKRLEPEIRKFLQVFSRKATRKLADLVVTQSGDPKMVELRKNVVSFLYGQTLSELLANVDSGASQQAEIAAERIARAVLRSEHPRKRLREALDAFLRVYGEKTVGEWLAAVGATETPDLDAWAEILWPHLRRALGSPVAQSFFAEITREFYASLRVGGASGGSSGAPPP